MKIAYILNTYPIHSVVEDEIIELLERGHDISIFCIFDLLISRDKINTKIEKRLHEVQKIDYRKVLIKYLLLSPKRLIRFIFVGRRHLGIIGSLRAFQISEILKADKTDRIHCEFVSANSLFAMLISNEVGIPFSSTIHHSDLLYRPLERLSEVIEKARPFITISEFNKNYIAEKYGEVSKKVEIVRCGVNLEKFKVRDKKTKNVPPLIITVSWFRPVKALNILAEALVILDSMGVDFSAVVIGGGDEGKNEFRNTLKVAKITDKVSLLGKRPRDEVLGLLADSDIFVHPSTSEGIPVAIMEAMALGLPVVASNIMGNPEIIEDGRTGFLVSKNDPESLAMKLKELLMDEDLRINMGRHGGERINREYNLKKNVVLLEEIFKRYSG